MNDSGDLVPDPECLRTQTAEIPSASPSTQTPTTESQGSIAVNLAIAMPILVVLIIIISVSLTVVLRVWVKHRRNNRIVEKSTFPR